MKLTLELAVKAGEDQDIDMKVDSIRDNLAAALESPVQVGDKSYTIHYDNPVYERWPVIEEQESIWTEICTCDQLEVADVQAAIEKIAALFQAACARYDFEVARWHRIE